MDYYSGRLWPDVTSPLARRVLTVAFNLAPIDAEDTFYDIYKLNGGQGLLGRNIDSELEGYRRDLRTRLEQSDLVARILDPWWIEAIYEGLSDSRKRLLLMFRPRDVEASVRHFMHNVDWYVGLGRERQRHSLQLFALAAGGVLLAVVGIISVYMLTNNITAAIAGPLAIVGAAVTALVNLLGATKSGSSRDQKQLISRAEFYLYLRDALRDNYES